MYYSNGTKEAKDYEEYKKYSNIEYLPGDEKYFSSVYFKNYYKIVGEKKYYQLVLLTYIPNEL